MRKKLSQVEVMRLLKKDGWYMENYTFDCTIYSDDGDDMGTFSIRVFDELLKAGKIEYAGRNEMFWTKGYYRASAKNLIKTGT